MYVYIYTNTHRRTKSKQSSNKKPAVTKGNKVLCVSIIREKTLQSRKQKQTHKNVIAFIG